MAHLTAASKISASPAAHSSPKTPKPRKLKKPAYRSFRLQKPIRNATPPIAGSFKIFREAIGLLARNRKLFGGMVLVYAVLQLVLVQGFGSPHDVGTIKQSAEALVSGNLGHVAASLTSFGYLLGTAGIGGAYQSFVVLITSLALIWTIRQVYAGERPAIRDGFYQGIFPLVPFVLVLVVVALQALPAVGIITLFSFAVSNGIIAQGIEYLLWILLIMAGVLISLYMLCSSLFALYIVTLPGMTPLKALRTAWELVRFRRWSVMRRIIYLPIALVCLTGLIMVPLIMAAAGVAGYVFILISLFGITVIHSYMYRLYKELLV